MDRCKCYLCEKLCYCESQRYIDCTYRKQKSFGVPENREYETVCTKLAVKFARKHGWRFEGWVGHFDPEKHTWYEGAGGWASISDDVYSMEDMRTDIMMDAHPDSITEYMEQNLAEYEAAEREGREPRKVNYRNWLLGARFDPDDESLEYKEMRIQELREEQARLEETNRELRRMVEEQYQRNADELLANSDGLY